MLLVICREIFVNGPMGFERPAAGFLLFLVISALARQSKMPIVRFGCRHKAGQFLISLTDQFLGGGFVKVSNQRHRLRPVTDGMQGHIRGDIAGFVPISREPIDASAGEAIGLD